MGWRWSQVLCADCTAGHKLMELSGSSYKRRPVLPLLTPFLQPDLLKLLKSFPWILPDHPQGLRAPCLLKDSGQINMDPAFHSKHYIQNGGDRIITVKLRMHTGNERWCRSPFSPEHAPQHGLIPNSLSHVISFKRSAVMRWDGRWGRNSFLSEDSWLFTCTKHTPDHISWLLYIEIRYMHFNPRLL